MKVNVWLETGFAGVGYNETFEMNDNATEKEIKAAAKEVAFDRIDWGYEVVNRLTKKRTDTLEKEKFRMNQNVLIKGFIESPVDEDGEVLVRINDQISEFISVDGLVVYPKRRIK